MQTLNCNSNLCALDFETTPSSFDFTEKSTVVSDMYTLVTLHMIFTMEKIVAL